MSDTLLRGLITFVLNSLTQTRGVAPVTQANPVLLNIPQVVQQYGLAVLSVAIALGISLFLSSHNIKDVEFPVFLIAIALTVWYAGAGPAILALILASLAFNYYFTEPRHTFYVDGSDIPYYAVFIVFALLITWFATVRKRVERSLVESRDELQREVAVRTQQANLLNLTHDTIFVRDMNDTIVYWNRGAQELYGWSAEEAIGKLDTNIGQRCRAATGGSTGERRCCPRCALRRRVASESSSPSTDSIGSGSY